MQNESANQSRTRQNAKDDEPLQSETPIESDVEPLMSATAVAGWESPEAEDIQADEFDQPEDLSPYDAWKADPTPGNLYAVTKSLKPTIGSVLATLGGAGNPQLEARARVVAAKAVQSYDPSHGASLPTWVSQQLRQMTRDIRKSNNVLSIPDGVHLDAYAIYRAETELEDELGREPTVDEVADRSHIPVKRIAKVRRSMRATAGENGGEEGTETFTGSEKADFTQDAMDYIYNDSDTTDKKVMEMTVGYGGHAQLDNKAIMQKLKLTDVQLSRRKKRLAMRIQDVIKNLEAVQ